MLSVSLITVSFNPDDTIIEAFESAASQSVTPFEHIWIDASPDHSALQRVLEVFPRLTVIHEPDLGLYYALNKALSLVKGDIIGFLHADDLLASADILWQIQHQFKNPKVDAVYGDLWYVSSDLQRVLRRWQSGYPSSFRKGWMPPHPALYFRRSVIDRVGIFRTDLGTAADYEWMLRAIEIKQLQLAYLPQVVVKMRTGGMSNANIKARKSALFNDLRAWRVNGFSWPTAIAAVGLKKILKLQQFF